MKSHAITIIVAAAIATLLTGCETTTGYRKSSGGQYSNEITKLTLKNVTIGGNLVLDADGSMSNTGTSELGGTAEGATADVKATPTP